MGVAATSASVRSNPSIAMGGSNTFSRPRAQESWIEEENQAGKPSPRSFGARPVLQDHLGSQPTCAARSSEGDRALSIQAQIKQQRQH